jgi:hypothetical protein
MKKQDKNISNENNTNNVNNNDENKTNNFKTSLEKVIGAIWEHEGSNGGKYWKGKVKSLDENGDLLKDKNGNIIEFNINIFYNKFKRKGTDPTMLVFKPDRGKWEGKDYDKYKKNIIKEIKIKDIATGKNIKKNEDKLKEIDI